MASESREIGTAQRMAWILGLVGAAPFVAHALFSWVSPPSEVPGILRSQVHYAAVILTFVGALHWGVILGAPDAHPDSRAFLALVWGVLPAGFAWIVSLYEPNISLALLGVALGLALAVDVLLYRRSPVPPWFVVLRAVLTAVGCACVGLSWLASGARLG
ncbi:MAG TPA: DUF3429 domain-containing protein [Burkholderiaceae bacterium]|jgi:hypothetical protein|nr:DUF3429 domain-containing protein [Burkholderiaceae bacterium]